jgi:hypothetical protein
MRSGTAPITRLAVRPGGAVFLVAIWLLAAAPAQADTRPPQGKDQRGATKGKPDKPAKAETKAPPVKLGLQLNDPRALQGYTLISPFTSPNTYLLDMRGRVVHTWKTDCSPALCGVLLENGHLLRPGSIGPDADVFGPGPAVGGRVQEFTWEGELVWDFKFYNARQLPHHDLTRLPNGNVLLIVWDRKTTEEAIAAGRRPEMAGDKHFLPDSLVEIKPTGKQTGEVVWEWHLWDHLVQDFDSSRKNFGNVAQHPELVNINYGEDELPSVTAAKGRKDKAKPTAGASPAASTPPRVDPDFTHCNGVAYNADLDQIVLSVWKFSEFWIIDHSTTTAEAAGHRGGRGGKGGDLLYRWGNPRAYRAGTRADQKLFSQHNAHWIPSGLAGAGHILVFNNGVHRPGGDASSVDELVLPVDSRGHYRMEPGKACGPDKPVWSYRAPKKDQFYSWFISGAQRLPNGNTLICAGAYGTIFEVTPAKEVVWKYVNPAKEGKPFGPRPRPWQIMSAVAGDMLAISPEQRVRLNEIQNDIDAHLDKLLSAAQKKQAADPDAAGRFGSFRQPGMVLTESDKTRLKLTDGQKKDLSALQKAVDGRLDGVLAEAQRKQIKSVFTPAVAVRALAQAGNAAGPQPGVILSAGQQDTLKLSAAQKKRMAEIQKEIDAQLDTLLTEDQKRQLQAMRRSPANLRPAGPGGPDRDRPSGTPLFRAYRYPIDYPAFAGRRLTPGQRLEDPALQAHAR